MHLKSDFSPFHDAKKLILEDRIQYINEEIDQAYFNMRKCRRNLAYFVDGFTMRILCENAHSVGRGNAVQHNSILMNKLERLCRNSNWNRLSNVSSVVQLNCRALDANELTLLGLGLKFNCEASLNDMISTAAKFDMFIGRHGNASPLQGLLSPMLLSISRERPILPKRLAIADNKLSADKNLIILPADKGGNAVVMNRADYIHKASEILSDHDTYELLNSNPLCNVNKMVRSRVRQIASKCPDPQFFNRFYRQNPGLAYFYGLPKLHKEGCPLRQIISNVGTVTRPLAGWLAGILSPYLGTFSDAHLRNSLDFKNRFIEFAFNNSMQDVSLVSLDVKSLFTNVPLNLVVEFIDRKIESGHIQIPIPKPEFIALIELCVNNNYFQFEGKFYRQSFGISMGSPLSPVLAGLFMEYFESELLPTLSNLPKFWTRYVDDVFLIWPNSIDFNSFINELNSLVPSIKFSVEWEEGGSLPFLDLVIFRSGHSFKFSVYRKPTHKDQYMHYFSNQSQKVKRSAVFSLMLRAFRICDEEYLEQEIQKIFNAFINLGYPRNFLQRVLADVRRKTLSPPIGSSFEHSTNPVLVVPRTAFSERFAKPLSKAIGCRVVNFASNTLRSKLISTKPPSNSGSSEGEGVYVVPCSCGFCYVGQTGRSFDVRLREHKDCVRLGRTKNAICRHVHDNDHSIKWGESKIVYRSTNLNQRLVIESSLIKLVNNFNNCQGASLIDKASAFLILNSNRKISSRLPI